MRRVAASCQRLGWGIARTCMNKSAFERHASSSVLEASMDGNRAVLRLAGRDLYSFLQGLLTNDVHEIESKRKSIIYSAMLNPQGRFMYDMFLLSESKSTEEPVILMDVESQTLPDLMRSLIRYRLRAAVDICDVSNEYTVKVLFGDNCSGPSKEWHVDPRLPCLGYRAILPRGEDRRANNGTALDYLDWRVENGVAEGCLEIPSGSAFPFEYNLDGLMGINFSKGCYVGQELTARTKYRGVVRKRLLPVHLRGQHLFVPGEAIFELGKTGRPVGQMRVVGRNGKGLAHLRLTAAFSEEDRYTELHIQGDDSALIHPIRPSWWDSSWGHEEE